MKRSPKDRNADLNDSANKDDAVVEATHPKRSKVSGGVQSLRIQALPCQERYETSFMHRDIVSHVTVARTSEFIMTGSVDGQLKFWRCSSWVLLTGCT